MATSGTFETKGIRGGDGVFRNFEFNWEVTSTTTGATTIYWELIGIGGGTSLSTFIVKLNDEIVLQKNNETVYYKNNIVAGSGTKTIYHDADGNANLNFYIEISKIWAEIATPVKDSNSWALENNKPYSACYWSSNASVKINTTIQKPGANITISWSGANAGTANPIKGYRVEFSIDSGTSWKTISESTSTTSAILKVPDNRGSTIIARVKINSSISNSYDSNYLQGGSCVINRVPGAPTVVPSATFLPSTQATISFNVTKGNDPDGQSCSIKYTVGTGTTYYDYTSGSGISISSGKTIYYFYTYDGLEYSPASSKEIHKNSKPTVSVSVSGDGTFNQTLIASKGNNGHTSNSYNFGYSYNGVDYTLSQNQADIKYTIGDIRAFLSGLLGGLTQSVAYKYKYWIQRNDGIESSSKAYTSEQSFTIPILTVAASGSGPAGYFGTKISIGATPSNYYYPLGERTFNDNEVARGKQITDLTFRRDQNSNQYFTIILNPNQKLTRVYAFDFANLSFPSVFKPYSTAKLNISMAGRGASYGFSAQPDVSYPSKTLNKEGASSNNTWNYSFDPNHLWGSGGLASALVGNKTGSKTITLSVTNGFGETYTKNCTLNFDFNENPVLENFNITIDGISLSKFSYIKEGVKIGFSGTVKSYNGKFSYTLSLLGETCYSKTSGTTDSYNTEPWTYNSSTKGWDKSPNVISLNESGYILQPKQVSSSGPFTIAITTNRGKIVKDSNSIAIKRYVASQIHFTELKYSPSDGTNGSLTGSFVVDEYGYDNDTNGIIREVYTQDTGKNYTLWSNGNGSYSFSISFPNFTEAYKLLAPICVTELSAVYTENGASKTVATTEKTTSAPVYLAVYNMLPTVAYRQNYLGINTNNPDWNGNQKLANTAVTISGYNNNQRVYLVSGSHTSYINLLTGSLYGFVLDGGSWDGTSGEIIVPGGSNIPTDLATIAYTGEIGDLEQTRQDVIIFSGGSAPTT